MADVADSLIPTERHTVADMIRSDAEHRTQYVTEMGKIRALHGL